MLFSMIYVVLNLIILANTQQISSQCQCVLKPGTNECLKYDITYQATSINEAVKNFPDLTLEDEKKEDLSGYGGMGSISEVNETACQDLLLEKLAQVGLVSNNSKIQAKINKFINKTAELTCSKYRFSKPYDPSVYEYGHKHDKDDEEDSSSSSEESNDDHGDKEKKHKKEKKKKDREKRQTVNQNNSTIGTRYNLSCSAKGVDDGSGYLKLCSACWAWRRLPDNYFPQYVNELVCDDTDGGCLSGYATCGVGTRTFEVIKNDTGIPTIVTLTAGSYCECKVLAGSAIQNLVTGSSGNLPPLNLGSTTQRNLPIIG